MTKKQEESRLAKERAQLLLKAQQGSNSGSMLPQIMADDRANATANLPQSTSVAAKLPSVAGEQPSTTGPWCSWCRSWHSPDHSCGLARQTSYRRKLSTRESIRHRRLSSRGIIENVDVSTGRLVRAPTPGNFSPVKRRQAGSRRRPRSTSFQPQRVPDAALPGSMMTLTPPTRTSQRSSSSHRRDRDSSTIDTAVEPELGQITWSTSAIDDSGGLSSTAIQTRSPSPPLSTSTASPPLHTESRSPSPVLGVDFDVHTDDVQVHSIQWFKSYSDWAGEQQHAEDWGGPAIDRAQRSVRSLTPIMSPIVGSALPSLNAR